jgi:catechol 2,3-dioxygenase-like lactoylglutathione lyase family enzyme
MPDILKSTFVLSVTDLNRSVAFYRDVLGFDEEMRVEGWSFLRRGECRLRIGDCPGTVPMSAAADHSWFAYLHVTDAAGLYAEVVSGGVTVWHAIQDKPWGMREFGIVTPDGHRIVFGEVLAAVASHSKSGGAV